MVILRRITDAKDKDFQELMKLYVEAFPEEDGSRGGEQSLFNRVFQCLHDVFF